MLIKPMPEHHSSEGRDRPSSADNERRAQTTPKVRRRSQRRRSCPAGSRGTDDEAILPWDGTADASSAWALALAACEQRSPADATSSFDSRREALCKHYHNPRATPGATTAFHPERLTMKRNRRDKTATYGMVGAGVGTLILPVVGTVVGGFLSGYAANQSLKRQERKVQRRWERDQFQRDASASNTARHAVFV